MKATLGLDVGTTSVKAVVLGQDGQVLAEGTSDALPMGAPHPGWATQPTAAIHDAVMQCLQMVVASLSESDRQGLELTGLASAVQSGSLVLVDGAGRIAEDLTTWMDTRCSALVQNWHVDGTADTIRSITGWTVHAGQGLPQLAWTRANFPDLLTGRAASADDLVTYWLMGEWVTNPSNAAGMALMDITTEQWDSSLCDLAGVEVSQLSVLQPCGSVVGKLGSEVEQASGLVAGLPVINGGHDQACAALALGISEPAQAVLAGGTAWVLTTVIRPDAAQGIPEEMNVSHHVVPGLLTASTYLGGMGVCLEWWLEVCQPGVSTDARFADLIQDLAGATTTLESPFFHLASASPGDTDSPERIPPGAGTFVESSSDSSDTDRARAIMEFAAFQVRTALLALPAGQQPTSLTIVGGATRLPGWSQMIADVCDLPVVAVATQNLPALGAAVLAGAATGVFPNVQTGAATLTIDRTQFLANTQMAELFVRRYQQHLQQESQL